MGLRPVGLVRLGFRRLGSRAGAGLPYTAPLNPNALVYINSAGTSATTSPQLLFDPAGEGSLAVLFDGTTYTPITDRAALLVKKTSGIQSAIFDAGGFAANLIELRNGGGGSADAITSSNINGLQIGGNAGGFTNSGISLQPGSPGFSSITISTDQVFIANFGGKVGFFNTTPVGQRTRVGTIPAGATYNANTQNLLNDCVNTLRGVGLLS